MALVAGACPVGLRAWTAAQGSLATTPRCGVVIGATDADTTAYSWGVFHLDEPVAPPFELRATWRRMTPDNRSIEIFVRGAVVLFRDERVALWVDDDHFSEATSWRPVPGYRVHADTSVVVVQRADEIEVRVGGAVVRFPFTAPAQPGRVGFGLKGAPGTRATLRLADVSVRRPSTPR
jgi:hypothetical protein